MSKKLGADNAIVYEESDEQFLKNLADEEGLLDSAIVFEPSDSVINAAIRSVKKGGIVVLGVRGNVANFPTFEEKIVKGSVIGTRRDMADLIKMASNPGLQVIIERKGWRRLMRYWVGSKNPKYRLVWCSSHRYCMYICNMMRRWLIALKECLKER